MTKKKGAAHPELGSEKGNAAALDDNDDITALILTVNRVERELESNTALNDYVFNSAREHVERGTRFGMQAITEELRWTDRTDSNGKDMAINNNDAAIIARLIVERIPEAAQLIELRRSKFDAVFEARRAIRGTAQEAAS